MAEAGGGKLKIKCVENGRYRYRYTATDGSVIRGRITVPPVAEGVASTPWQEGQRVRGHLEALAYGLSDAIAARNLAKEKAKARSSRPRCRPPSRLHRRSAGGQPRHANAGVVTTVTMVAVAPVIMRAVKAIRRNCLAMTGSSFV